MTNPIRPGAAIRASLLGNGKAEVSAVPGGWGQNDGKARQVKPGDLPLAKSNGRSQSPHTSDEAPVMGVERRPGRKVDA